MVAKILWKNMLNKNIILFVLIAPILLTGCKEESEQFLGYVEGRYTYVATNYGGILEKLNVRRGDEVLKDTILFKLESQPESDEVMNTYAELKAQMTRIESLEADAELQKLIVNRREKLLKQKYAPEEEVDTSKFRALSAITAVAAARHNTEALRAANKIAQFKLAQKSLSAPFSGLVHDTYYTEGELVTNGTPILALLHPDEVKVIFFIPERILSQYHLKDIIEVTCDSCTENIKARIDFISDKAEFTPPVIYSNEIRAKLVFRVEAKPLVEKPYYVLHPGQPVQILTNKKINYGQSKLDN